MRLMRYRNLSGFLDVSLTQRVEERTKALSHAAITMIAVVGEQRSIVRREAKGALKLSRDIAKWLKMGEFLDDKLFLLGCQARLGKERLDLVSALICLFVAGQSLCAFPWSASLWREGGKRTNRRREHCLASRVAPLFDHPLDVGFAPL